MAIEQFGYRQQLRRSLSLSDLIIYGMIFMIPIAPFGVYGWVHADAHGMVPMAYLVGMLAMLFTALSYGRMAAAFPVPARPIPTCARPSIPGSASSPAGRCCSTTCSCRWRSG